MPGVWRPNGAPTGEARGERRRSLLRVQPVPGVQGDSSGVSDRMPNALHGLLRRSEELHHALSDQLSRASVDDSTHADLTLATAQLAFEHGISIAVLVETGHLSSANVLLRAQLEATIRAAWFLYVATDEWIDGYLAKARSNPTKDPGCAPGVDDMIRAIERKAAE